MRGWGRKKRHRWPAALLGLWLLGLLLGAQLPGPESRAAARLPEQVWAIAEGGSASVVLLSAAQTAELWQAAADFGWHEPLAAAAVMSSAFGERHGGLHHGVDLACAWGTMIRTVAPGTVTEAGWKNDTYGYFVAIDHGGGWVSRYAHCAALAVAAGEKVESGQAIAIVGSSGNSTGPHLHLELIKDGLFVDPLLLVPAVIKSR